MTTFKGLEIKVIQWAEARGIVKNSSALSQSLKTLEEVTELLNAIVNGDRDEQIDAYGDILVTLIVGCAISDLDLTKCLESAYAQIKNRKGYLNAQGVFVKESAK